jgi:hypothetical protein
MPVPAVLLACLSENYSRSYRSTTLITKEMGSETSGKERGLTLGDGDGCRPAKSPTCILVCDTGLLSTSSLFNLALSLFTGTHNIVDLMIIVSNISKIPPVCASVISHIFGIIPSTAFQR